MNMTTKGALVVGAVAVLSFGLFDWPQARADEESWFGRGASTRDAVWATECGACHVPYPPQLLPTASWERVMDGLSSHFGENAELPADTTAHIRRYLAAHAADARGMRWRYDGGDDKDRTRTRTSATASRFEMPMRITETRWFIRAHHEVGSEVWSRPAVGSAANCGACHQGAAEGIFDEHRVRIPR
ncbi:cytochrome C [Nitrogeniibacter mangrovi]|uniref:Cytochrome C n=1 Tax=Nitrogeniibacter mangrovi TaxID=2016596 RepID=A0A6C1B457_9RHOO|nr:diheme cytochrome c [Nitrogeniibacter mangrovi]QID18462.1 cytochrome C [Nitrogeniibacter mangrovi]